MESGDQHSRAGSPLPTLLELERTIQSRREAAEAAEGGTPPNERDSLPILITATLTRIVLYDRSIGR